MHRLLLALLVALPLLIISAPSQAMSWKTSCGADRGAITKASGVYTFKTSRNHCTGGVFNQRAELVADNFSVSRKVTYLFDTTIAMTSKGSNDFVVFQVQDGRDGCSPPLSLRWMGNGTLRFDSDYTRGQGMDGCVENRNLRNAQHRGAKLKRDGTSYRLQVQVAFDGQGAFDVAVLVDGTNALSGRYEPSGDPSFVASKKFFMKHGVYSRDMFDYVMTSTGMKVTRQ